MSKLFHRIFVAILVAFLVTALGHYYLYLRFVVPFFGTQNELFNLIFYGLWSVTFFGFVLIRSLSGALRRIFEFFMFFWMGVAYVGLLLCLITAPLHIFFAHNAKGSEKLALIVLGLTVVLSAFSFWKALKKPDYIVQKIHFDKNIPGDVFAEISKLKIILVSDIHVNGIINRRRMEKLKNCVNAAKPDLIFVLGDLVDGSVRQLRRDVEPLKHLQAKQGVFYITGNHEYYSGPEQWKNYLHTEFGWTVLSNKSAIVSFEKCDLCLFGFEDRLWLKYKKEKDRDSRMDHVLIDFEKKRNLEKPPFFIFLTHQPKDSYVLLENPWIHLQVSGHTHAGQLWPLKYLVLKDQKFLNGLYQTAKNQFLYVTQGSGFWGPPFRLGTRCEVVELNLKFNC